ncbi:hypothetical protein HNV10_09135 [Winogradskyella litoriviva]|uniref:Uncharacterized protein n=1 Tax=Winogradskyella litoriviva TaxID=1220182 RepID=A0ABX2E4U5_9FLAO|nr:hypothetical protein [Winogradskyella litoriviva]NRD23403.1 hypothetical protein [Winogradskyella litoriviva]
MLVNKILKGGLLLLGGIYILLEGLAKEVEGAVLGAILLVLLIWLYSRITIHKSKFFYSFLIVFTLGQILSAISWFRLEIEEGEIDYMYFLTNILFIISYVLLILKTVKQLNLKVVFSELTTPIIVLVVLDVFCVSLISGTTEVALSNSQYILEYVYNAVVMTLLSFALIDYMYRNNSKSMLFLLAAIFMTFSEIIQLAYYYILQDDNLGFIYAFFLVIAFVFFYLQSQYKVTAPVAAYEEESLEVKNS